MAYLEEQGTAHMEHPVWRGITNKEIEKNASNSIELASEKTEAVVLNHKKSTSIILNVKRIEITPKKSIPGRYFGQKSSESTWRES